MPADESRPMRFEDTEHERRRMAVDVARLQEQVTTLGREMGELKKVNAEQTDKLTKILEQLAEARGGLRTTLWFGGAMASSGAALVWVVQQLVGKHP